MSSSSYTKSSKASKKVITREPSVLDEHKIYFATWLSPLRKKSPRSSDSQRIQRHNNGAYEEQLGARNHQSAVQDSYPCGYNYKAHGEENVDAQAERFIAMKHKKFELTKWMSRNY